MFNSDPYITPKGTSLFLPIIWKYEPRSRIFDQSELQQIQHLIREELSVAHDLCELKQLTSKGFKYYKKRIKKLSALQSKVKRLANV